MLAAWSDTLFSFSQTAIPMASALSHLTSSFANMTEYKANNSVRSEAKALWLSYSSQFISSKRYANSLALRLLLNSLCWLLVLWTVQVKVVGTLWYAVDGCKL